MLTLRFYAVFALFPLVQAQTWTQVTPSASLKPSSGFRGHSAVLFNQSILIFGGYFVGERFNDLWTWSIEDSTWTSMSFNETPSPRSGHSAVLDANFSMWIFGGSLGTAGPYVSPSWVTNELYYLDTQAQQWIAVEASSSPSGRSGHSAVLDLEDRIWVFGGWGGPESSYSVFDDLYRFDIQAETWTLLSISGSPSARFLHSAVLEDPEIPRMWVFGGSDGFSLFNDLNYFDLQALSWTSVNAAGNIPVGRSEHTAVVDSKQGMWVFGGQGVSVGYDELYYLHFKAETWNKIEAAEVSSYGRYGHSAVVDESLRMWIYGWAGFSYEGDWYYLELKTTTSSSSTSTTVSQTTSTSSTASTSTLSATWSLSTSTTSTTSPTSTMSTMSTTSTTSTSSTSSSRTGSPTDLPQTLSSTSTATVDDFWENHLLMDRITACGPVPVVASKVRSEIETMDDWKAEVEISPCLDARPVHLRWEYRCEGCAWELLETALVDLDARPSVLRLNAFTFEAETNHEIMVSASYEETFSPNASLLFPLHILPKRRPVAIISGPHVVSSTCRFTLSARTSRDVSSASSAVEDFFYVWSLWDAEGLDVSHLLTVQQQRAVDLDVAAGTFPLGRYVVKLQLWRRAETIDQSGETQFQLFVGAQAMPVVSIESSWLPGDRVSTEADSTNITAHIGLSSPDCLVENLSAWSWRWLLLEDRSQDVVADFGAMSDGQTLVMSTSSFHDFVMPSGEQYCYGVAGIPASFTSYGFAELFGLGLTLSKSHRFTADVPPGGGTVEARPCRVTSIASPITYRTFGWQDEDPEGLEYAFFRFSAAIIASTAEAAIDGCEDLLALPDIQWEDVTSPNYFRALGGVMLRDWAKSPWFETLMPSGKFYILVRARDSVGGKADAPWLLAVDVGSQRMDATEMTSLLNAQLVTGDAQRIFTSTEAILSMGTSGDATMQQDLLRALQVASEAMDPSPESMEGLASIVGEVASLAPVNNETGHAATSMLRRILTLSAGTNAFHDRRVATSMFNTIGKVTENTPKDVLGDPQGFQGEVQALALALGDAMVSQMENESFVSLTNSQMQLEVSKSERMVTAGCSSCDSEHIQKGRLHMETNSMMAGSRRLQGSSSVLQTVTVTAKLLVWKDFKVGHLDPRKGFNIIVPSRVDAIVTEINQDCIGTEPLIHTIGTRHMWPSDPQPAMTRTTCAQFNETEVVWSEAVAAIYGKKMHVDCFSSPSCGNGVQRTTSTVLHAPDVWGTFADAMFFLWICVLILVVAITLAVTVILSVYKFETHVKHVAGPPPGRWRQSQQEGPKAHAWSVVPAQIEHRAEITSSEPSGYSGSEDVHEIPRARMSALVGPSPKTSRRPSFAARGPTLEQGRVRSQDLLGPLESGPLEAPQIDPPADAVMLGRPQEALQELVGSAHALVLSEEVERLQSSVKEAWG